MSEGSRLVQCGTVGGTPVLADVSPIGFGSVVKVVIGGTNYVASRPPGWPTRPQDTGAVVAEGGTFTVLAGVTFAFHACEAAALVNAGFATYA